MKHEISKLHPIHQQMYKQFISSEYTPDKVPDNLYEAYLRLSEIPKKDWDKPETQEAIKASRVIDENIK